MPFDPKTFMDDLLKDVNLKDEDKAALGAALANPVVSKRLEEGQLRQSDYSRLSAEAQAIKTRATSYYDELTAWKQQEAVRLEAERTQLAAANPNGVAVNEPSYLSKADFNTEITKIQSGAIGFLTALSDKQMEYFQEFGKRLDTNAVLEKAQKDGTNFLIAYERYVQPAREEKSKVDFEARIKREREEAAAEALANASIPTAGNAQVLGGNPHVLDMIAKKPEAGFGWKAAADAHHRDMLAGTVKHE